MELKGLKKNLNEKMRDDPAFSQLKSSDKHMIQDAINDALVEWIKTWGIEEYVADKVREAAAAVGFELNLTNIRDKQKTRADVDAAVTKKINDLAGVNFESISKINRESLSAEVGKMIGAQLGLGDLGNVPAFRAAMSNQLVSAFEGQTTTLFSGNLVAAVEANVVAGWRNVTEKTEEIGNPAAVYGPPRDAAHAATRAANRRRQAKFRASHYVAWVPLGYGAESTGNGREGLTGRDAGNMKSVRRWLRGEER